MEFSSVLFLMVAMVLLTPSSSDIINKQLHNDTNHGCFLVSTQTTGENVAVRWEIVSSSHNLCTGYSEIKLECIGEQHLIDTDGRKRVFEIKQLQFFPSHATQGLLSKTKPNMRFQCELSFMKKNSEFSKELQGMTDKFTFRTPLAAPPRPQKPNVVVSTLASHLYTVELHNTTTSNGPIKGYEVQFLLVDGIPLDDEEIPMTINKETHEPFADILLAKEAEVSKTPMSFCYRYEEMDEVDQTDKFFIPVASHQIYSQYGQGNMTNNRFNVTVSTKGLNLRSLEKLRKNEFRETFSQNIFYIGLSAIPLTLLITGVIATFVYNKMTKDYELRKRQEFYDKRMKKSTRLNPKVFFPSKRLRQMTHIMPLLPKQQKQHTVLPPDTDDSHLINGSFDAMRADDKHIHHQAGMPSSSTQHTHFTYYNENIITPDQGVHVLNTSYSNSYIHIDEVISDHASCIDLNVDELLNRYHSGELSNNKTNDHDDCGRHCSTDIKKTGNNNTFV